MFRIDLLWMSKGRHSADVNLGRNQDVLRTSLRKPGDNGFTHLSVLPGGTLKLYFKNVINVTIFIDCVKLTFSGRPQSIIMGTSPRDIFHTFFGCLSTHFMQIWKLFFMFLYMFTYISITLPMVIIQKTTIQNALRTSL